MSRTSTGPPGVKRLSDSEAKDPRKGRERRSRGRGGGSGGSGKGGDVGDALRKVYDNTLDEKIPSSMLDLLGKLN